MEKVSIFNLTKENSKIYENLELKEKFEYKKLLNETIKYMTENGNNIEDFIDSIFKYKKEIETKDKMIKKLEENINKTNYYKYSNGEVKMFYPKILTKKILEQFEVINTSNDFDNNLVYHNGVYLSEFNLPEGRRLNKYIYDLLSPKDPHITTNLRNTLKCIAEEKKISPDDINKNVNYINFKNGLLNTNNWQLENHSSNILSTIQIKANYEEKKTIEGTLFEKFITKMLPDNIIPVIQEIFGYILSNESQLQKFFIFKGKGNNGKSVLLKIMNALYDKSFISSCELKELSKPEYVANLYNKKINTCGDMSSEYITNTGLIKQLVGEDPITARPLYQNPFTFTNNAKMIFSCNEMPGTSDKTYAFMRRLVIIPFEIIIKENEKDTKLAEKIINNELENIAIWAIEGLKRLKSNNFVLSDSEDIKNAVNRYEISNNSVKEFIYNFCNIDLNNDDLFIPKTEFTQLYKSWCKQEGSKSLSAKHINSILSNMGLSERNHIKYKGRYWINISWQYEIKDFIDTLEFQPSIKGSIKKKLTEDEIKKIDIKPNFSMFDNMDSASIKKDLENDLPIPEEHKNNEE